MADSAVNNSAGVVSATRPCLLEQRADGDPGVQRPHPPRRRPRRDGHAVPVQPGVAMRALVASFIALAALVALEGVALAQSASTGPTVEFWYRRGSIAEPGADGTTNTGGLAIFPLHRIRALRWIRFGVGAEVRSPRGRRGALGHPRPDRGDARGCSSRVNPSCPTPPPSPWAECWWKTDSSGPSSR